MSHSICIKASKFFLLPVVIFLAINSGKLAAQQTKPLTQKAEQLGIENLERQKRILTIWGAGTLALTGMFGICWCCFRNAPENSLRRRLIGSLVDPEALANARFQATLAEAGKSGSHLPFEISELSPELPLRPGLADWAKDSGNWLTRCEVIIETWPRRTESEPPEVATASEATLQELQRELAPHPYETPSELLERARLCVRCRTMFPKSGWPLLYELACHSWAGNRSGVARLVEEIRPAQLRGADKRLLAPLGQALRERGRYREAAVVYSAIASVAEYKSEGEAMTAWCRTLEAGEKAERKSPSNWRNEVTSMQQRLAAMN